MLDAARAKQLWDGISYSRKFEFPYEIDLTFNKSIFMMISHDECMCVIHMRCWLLRLESREEEHQEGNRAQWQRYGTKKLQWTCCNWSSWSRNYETSWSFCVGALEGKWYNMRYYEVEKRVHFLGLCRLRGMRDYQLELLQEL